MYCLLKSYEYYYYTQVGFRGKDHGNYIEIPPADQYLFENGSEDVIDIIEMLSDFIDDIVGKEIVKKLKENEQAIEYDKVYEIDRGDGVIARWKRSDGFLHLVAFYNIIREY